MKVVGVLGALLALLVLLGLSDVHAAWIVSCSSTMILVKVDWDSLVGNLPVQAQELTLGSGCPVTREELFYFEFYYNLTSCGIQVHDEEAGTVIETSITYNSLQLDFEVTIPVKCIIPRSVVPCWAGEVPLLPVSWGDGNDEFGTKECCYQPWLLKDPMAP